MKYYIQNHELYEFITRFNLDKINVNTLAIYINDEITPEIDLIVKHLTKNKEISITREKKINNDLVYEIILDCYKVNSNLRPYIHKRVNIEDNYYLITCVTKALHDLNYITYNKNNILVSEEVIDINNVYNIASIYYAFEIMKTNKELALMFLYLHNADQNNIKEIKIESLIELVYNKLDFLIGEKQSAKSYIQALKKLPALLNILGAKVNINNETITIENSFYQNIDILVITNDINNVEISYNNIESFEAQKIIDKVLQSIGE